MTFVHHVTLNTGHVRRSNRDEILPETWQPVTDLLSAALSGAAPIPGVRPIHRLMAIQAGRCLMASVLAHGGDVRAPGYGPYGQCLVTIGVAPHSRCGSTLWRRLHQGEELATSAEDVPPELWCAARLEVGIAAHPEAAHWLGDLERCLAWVWIERYRELRG